MSASAGAVSSEQDAADVAKPAWEAHLRAELAELLRRCVGTNARWRLALMSDPVDLVALGPLAAESALLAARIAGLVQLLKGTSVALLVLLLLR